ncbi:Hydroxysqualene synthase [uncultured Gammaproteobacteria bacterium]
MIETPSGKSAKDENFPVGSWLLPPALRPHIALFYAFARAGDDIADNPALAPAEKVERLTAFGQALQDGSGDPAEFGKAHRLRHSLIETNVTPRHGLDLLEAFKRDATKLRYDSWDDLIGYCRLSASPVGRYLLDLHGEVPEYRASDALCDSLQILNHLQDCQEDHRDLDRVYLPGDWMTANGVTIDQLQGQAATPGLRRVINLCLDGVDDLLRVAATLPGQLRSRRLAMESAVILMLARRLSTLLRRGDPIAGRVGLSKADFLAGGISGVFRALVS